MAGSPRRATASPRPRSGAGAARAPARGARARPLRDRGRPRSRGAGLRATRTSARVVSTEDEPAVDRLARAERVDGDHLARRGLAGGRRRARRRAARAAAPDRRGDRGARDLEVAPARALRRRRACRSRALLDEPRVPCVVKAPDRQGQRGLTLVRTRGGAPGRDRGGARGLAQRHLHRRGVRRRPGGDRERGLDRRRLPPADRHRPAHRRAACVRRRARPRLAGELVSKQHKLSSRRLAPRPRRSGSGTGRPTRRSGSARTDPAWSSWPPASAAATTPSSARLATGVDAERPRARLRAREESLVLLQHKVSVGRRVRSLPRRARGGAAGGRRAGGGAGRRGRRSTCGSTASRAARFGPLLRGADRAGA